jgi:hypothetical protein
MWDFKNNERLLIQIRVSDQSNKEFSSGVFEKTIQKIKSLFEQKQS